MKPLLVTSGEPAGIGPDLCLDLAEQKYPVVVLGDKSMLALRAKMLGRSVEILDYHPERSVTPKAGELMVWSLPCDVPVKPGQLNSLNAPYIIRMLTLAADYCLSGKFSGVVTAPVHKGVINQAGIAFTGHTEFFADHCGGAQVVMVLACPVMKVALLTTHLPLAQVPGAISQDLLIQVVRQLHRGLKQDFGIAEPRIAVAGLNPHAGEGGYLGREELDIIGPAIRVLQNELIHVQGPFSADTLFMQKNLQHFDLFLTMYHDQGLPVLKYASFGHAVNVTMGLPIVRTSVDHGTALELAGTNQADSGSLLAAVEMAALIAQNRLGMSI